MKQLFQVGGCCLVALLLFNAPLLHGADTVQQLVDTFKKTLTPSEPLLNADLVVKDTFAPGEGAAIGRVELAQGEGYIVHQKGKIAYRAARSLPLVQGDTLITGQQGRIQATIDDKSNFALAENSKLVLTKVFYKAATNERNSEINLTDGKARFKVVKVAEGSQYKINTPTAVAGIRGSDFALMVVPANMKVAELTPGGRLGQLFQVSTAIAADDRPTTVLVTGEDTTVTLTGLSGAPQTVGPYSLSYASGGAATAGAGIGAGTAMGVLNGVGPQMAAMRMPEHLR